MKRSALVPRLVAAAALTAAASFGPLTQLAGAGPAAPDVPDEISVDAGNKPFLVGHAEGVQIYTCTIIPAGYAWGPSTPRADLYDDSGKVIVTHFAGPSLACQDGSKVVAARIAGVPGATGAIPWLKLGATSATAGPDGARLAGTTFIQRINTAGGVAPSANDCNAGTYGTVQEVPYTADYVFWKKTGN